MVCDGGMSDREGPRTQGMLEVGDGNALYWEEWGSPHGVPAVYLHGGPGGTLGSSSYRNRFDLTKTRVIGMDQRGCGRSTPHAADASTSLQSNTTPHLIADIECLREQLGINAWHVTGASWGSSLALAYAQAHPLRVLGMVLFAVTATSRREVDWVTEGVGAVFPEAWDRLAGHAECAGIGYVRGLGRLVEAYAALMGSSNPEVRDSAAREWALWEDTHVSIGTGGLRRDPRWEDERFRQAFVRLTTHYWAHDGFCDPPLLSQMVKIQHIPTVLIHGRRDISSPAITAWDVHRSLPKSHLIIDEGDGHGGQSMIANWRRANDDLIAQVS